MYGQLHSDVPSSDDSVVGFHLCKQRGRELLDHHASNLFLLVLEALAVVVGTLQDSPSLVTLNKQVLYQWCVQYWLNRYEEAEITSSLGLSLAEASSIDMK